MGVPPMSLFIFFNAITSYVSDVVIEIVAVTFTRHRLITLSLTNVTFVSAGVTVVVTFAS